LFTKRLLHGFFTRPPKKKKGLPARDPKTEKKESFIFILYSRQEEKKMRKGRREEVAEL